MKFSALFYIGYNGSKLIWRFLDKCQNNDSKNGKNSYKLWFWQPRSVTKRFFIAEIFIFHGSKSILVSKMTYSWYLYDQNMTLEGWSMPMSLTNGVFPFCVFWRLPTNACSGKNNHALIFFGCASLRGGTPTGFLLILRGNICSVTSFSFFWALWLVGGARL